MEVSSFLTGVVAGYGIAIPVGAIAVLIIQVGIRCGFWCAASAGAGAATADLAYAVLAVVGGAALAGWVEMVEDPVRWVSAAALILVAVAGLSRLRNPAPPVQTTIPGRGEYAGTYFKFLGLTVINPLTVIYFGAFVFGLGIAEDFNAVEGTLFACGAFLASLSWQTLLAGVGGVARHRLPETLRTGAVVVGNSIVLAMAVVILVG